LVLYVTPVAGYPDHHTLVVARVGVLELTLRDDALDALIRAMTVVDNPWLSHSRRLSKDYERLCTTSAAWIYAAMICPTAKQLIPDSAGLLEFTEGFSLVSVPCASRSR
jgi:hypothetical protein